ncbi:MULTISPECIES: glycine betaine uptake BCCT transporter [Shouchella]|uniref:BCCT family transporter n=2 Tax=Shouchella TaxID=2893057 RepID=A0ABY7W5L3_9BACI|nr:MULTISPECIES: BCCT family transporter [Shouchella]MED4127438.1 BCCT family transporter [Shouchella miscanthi]WDF03906.1 BCCT family transporter [Shouchella hunanensis]
MKQTTSVFYISVIVALAFIFWGVVFPENMLSVTESIQGFISTELGWFYLLSATFYVAVGIYLIVSPFGSIRLGKPDEKPEYTYLTWFAFLFTAGMGIGLVFWGSAEPLSHYFTPASADPATQQAAAEAMRYSIFHWGIHPWAIYAVVALTLAYFQYRKDEPALFSSTFRPLIGHRVTGPIGKTIDVFVVFATIFGTATSLGFGAAQITAGLIYLFPSLENINYNLFQIVVIVIVTILFSISAMTGIDKGIRILSNLNVRLAILLMAFVLLLGPTSYIMGVFTQGIGSYVQNFFGMSFSMDVYDPESSWVQDWTLFYWAWWISWSPFVGAFIARVSRGRTIREFVIGVIALPSLFGAFWFSVFGGSSIYFENRGGGLYEQMDAGGTEMALFALLEQFPLTFFVALITVLLIASFFITSADSATVVLGMQTTGGNLNPPNAVKLIWGLIIAGTAGVLLVTSEEGLDALQTASIIGAFPFAIIIILMIVSLFKELRNEKETLNVNRERLRQERLALRNDRERVKREQQLLKKERRRLQKNNDEMESSKKKKD